jgi:hypothetical protein
MERTSICVACVYYGVFPASLSVDPACGSKKEADALCGVHRARMTEGLCVLCGRREPWVSPWPRSAIGCCERCFQGVFGDAHADRVALEISRTEGEEPFFPAGAGPAGLPPGRPLSPSQPSPWPPRRPTRAE